VFADYGADVIKVEHPVGGDPGRGSRLANGFHYYHEAFNRGKKSMTLDLRAPGARDVFMKLVSWADVLTENFRPGYLDENGFGYEDCKAVNPKIIYSSNSGFGPRGPWAERGSMDAVCQAMAGMTVAQGGGPSHRPILQENCPADQVGAMNFAFAITAALLHCERTGEGQKIETSQLGAW